MADVDLLRALLLQELEARLVLCEIRRVGLNFEIDSSTTTPQRKVEAIDQRDQVIVEWGTTMTEIEDQKKSSN